VCGVLNGKRPSAGMAGGYTTNTPTHACIKPDTPGPLASKNQLKIFANDQKTYRDCLQDFVKAQSALSKLHMEAANAAIKEHNDYVAASSKKPVETPPQ
jgi:hypothetical protein